MEYASEDISQRYGEKQEEIYRRIEKDEPDQLRRLADTTEARL
jgi:hypothetical protein